MTDKEIEDELELEDIEEPEVEEEGEEEAPKPAEPEEEPAQEDDEKRKRRAEERRIRRERQKQARIQDKLTIQRLREQTQTFQKELEDMRRWRQEQETREADARLNNAAQSYDYAKRMAQDALEKGDTANYMRWNEQLIKANSEYTSLSARKPQEQPQPRHEPDTTVAVKAARWAASNKFDSWTDMEKRYARAVDLELAEEGFDPKQDSYYDMLTERLKPYVNHFSVSDRPRTKPRAVTAGASGDLSVVDNNTEKGLPKEYIDRCKKAGMWETPEQRKEMKSLYLASVKQQGKV